MPGVVVGLNRAQSPGLRTLSLIGLCTGPTAVEAAMSTRRKLTRKSSGHLRKTRKYGRSLSVSPERAVTSAPSAPRPVPNAGVKTRSWDRNGSHRYRAISACEYVEMYLGSSYDSLKLSPGSPPSKKLAPIAQREVCFPFDQLPTDCKLKVFSFLEPLERGKASQVCSEWSDLLKAPTLWNNVDLCAFPLCHITKASHICAKLCYASYKVRMQKFITYLQDVRPVIKRLSLAYDIGDKEDNWLSFLEGLIKSSRLHDLEFANLNWKETPIKPFWMNRGSWSTNEYNEFMYRHRHRQRVFVHFFDLFTSKAQNIKKMILPFDWSNRSLMCLSRLKQLHTLVLEKYFIFQSLEQSALDQFFQCVPSLRRLVLEVWTPSGRGVLLYHIRCKGLEYLDISQCRGFFPEDMDLPNLEILKANRHPMSGPLTCRDTAQIPCLFDVVSAGAPALKQINEHKLRPCWRSEMYEDLATVFNSICACRKHKAGWNQL